METNRSADALLGGLMILLGATPVVGVAVGRWDLTDPAGGYLIQGSALDRLTVLIPVVCWAVLIAMGVYTIQYGRGGRPGARLH